MGAMITSTDAASALSKYHPVVIEGMGGYDPRNPITVARQITSRLLSHWEEQQQQQQHASSNNEDDSKPKIVIIQGDPLEERGISAITPLVAKQLGIKRGLVLLDAHIADYHPPNADYDNVMLQLNYTEMAAILQQQQSANDSDGSNLLTKLEQRVDQMLVEKNKKRHALQKPPLQDYFRNFCLLQEVTKAACRHLCGGDITIAHTAREISEFSVTSFYTAGLDLGLVSSDDFVTYGAHDDLDFDALEKIRYGI